MNQKVGRNDPCPCGSGKKYKQCCWKTNQSIGNKSFTAKVLTSTATQIGKAFQNTLKNDSENP